MNNCKKCGSELKEGVGFCGVCGASVKKDSILTERLKAKYITFVLSCILYAVLYTICLYENTAAVTFPILMLITLGFYYFTLKKLEITTKKISVVYYIFILLIGISMFLTDDIFVHIFNYLGIMILILVSLITNFYNERKWEIGKYIGSMFRVGFGAIGNIYRPFTDLGEYRKRKDKKINKNLNSILIGLCIAVPLLIIIIILLASADAVFGNVFKNIFKDIDWIIDVVKIIIITFLVFILSYGLLAKLSKQDIIEENPDRRTREPIIAITITGLLSIVYIIFSAIQIIYLFMGQLSLPKGYTYAEYAREGFFQLLFVCLINLLIVLLCTSLFKKNKFLQVVLIVMSLCTFIMIASSALRMIMYIKGYDLTILRILVLWALAVIALLLFGLCIKIFVDKFPLFRYGIIVISLLYTALAFSRPDYTIAKYNLNDAKGEVDYIYLSELSNDAAPALEEFIDKNIDENYENGRVIWAMYYYFEGIQDDKYKVNFRNFNLSRVKATEVNNNLDQKLIDELYGKLSPTKTVE